MDGFENWSHASETGVGAMITLPLTEDRFPDMEALFGDRGVARRCFCMHWRRPDGGFPTKQDNRDRFAEVVQAARRPPGLLGYVDDRPVGWVQVGPRSDFPTVARSRLLKPVDEVPSWSINCFVVAPGNRKQGIAQGLLAAAVQFARDAGAAVIEAYPVDGTRSSTVDYFTGIRSMFVAHGFVEIARRNDTRPIVRLTVPAHRTTRA